MDPILRVIHYFCEKKGKHITEKTISDFFENGISFPQFVALSFDIDVGEIPEFNPHPKIFVERFFNNFHAYEFILNNNDEIRKISPDFGTQETYRIVLSLLLVKQCFCINVKEISYKISIIFNRYETLKSSELTSLHFLLKLLNKLTGEHFSTNFNFDHHDNFLVERFKKAKTPLIIDQKCFNTEYQFLFLIQIKIMFDVFEYKFSSMEMNHAKELKNINMVSEYYSSIINGIYSDCDVKMDLFLCYLFSFEIKGPDYINTNDTEKVKMHELNNVTENIKMHKLNNATEKVKIHELNNDKYILDTINEIGKKYNIFYKDFLIAVEDNNFLEFIIHLFEDDQIAVSHLQELKSNYPCQIQVVIEFLKEKDSKFKILLLDFDDEINKESSSISLYTNVLDSFFLKKSKDELYDRCYTLLYGKYRRRDLNYHKNEDAQGILYDWNTYIMLIDFIDDKDAKIIHNSSKKINQQAIKNNTKVPVVISEKYLNACTKEYIPNAIFYQLQFIFNELDKSDFLHHIVEYFLITIRKFAQLRVPPFSKLVASIKTKNISLIIQNKNYKQNLQKKSSENIIKDENQNIEENQSKYKSKHKESKNKKSPEETNVINSNNENLKCQKKYVFEDGILFEEGFENGSQTFQDIMKYAESYERNEISSDILKYVDEFKENESNSDETESEESINEYSNKFEETESSPDEKESEESAIEYSKKYEEKESTNAFHIYKLFSYNEDKKSWFIRHQYNFTLEIPESIDKKIILVLFLESCTKRSFKLLRIISNQQLKNIKKYNDEISIIGLLNKDNHLFDGVHKKTELLFMFLNVPKKKQNLPNIRAITFQIYFFLSFISDINIVILDREKCIEQTKFINNINKLKNHLRENSSQLYVIDGVKNVHWSDIKNYCILVDDDSICNHKANKDIEKANLFNEIKSLISYININDKNSYYDFINNFRILGKEFYTECEGLEDKFLLLTEFHMDDYYANWVFNDFSEEYLTQSINTKIKKYEGKNRCNFYDPKFKSSIMRNLDREYPSPDDKYENKCIHIISKIVENSKNELSLNLKKELKKSSKKEIKRLSEVIKSRIYWSNEQLNNFRDGFTDFLKDEFFTIIQELYVVELIPLIYEENEKILENRIRKDRKKIEKILDQVEKQQKVCSSTIEVDAEKGTNYTIREIENEREVKARIESTGKLEDLIEQDF